MVGRKRAKTDRILASLVCHLAFPHLVSTCWLCRGAPREENFSGTAVYLTWVILSDSGACSPPPFLLWEGSPCSQHGSSLIRMAGAWPSVMIPTNPWETHTSLPLSLSRQVSEGRGRSVPTLPLWAALFRMFLPQFSRTEVETTLHMWESSKASGAASWVLSRNLQVCSTSGIHWRGIYEFL